MLTGIACEISEHPETPKPHGTTSPPIGGNYAIQGSDTPATRGQQASHGAKPPEHHHAIIVRSHNMSARTPERSTSYALHHTQG